MNLLERRRALMMQVKKKSKNLFNASLIPSNTYITNNGDGSFSVKGGAQSRNTYMSLQELCPDLKVGDVATLSGVSNGGKRIAVKTLWSFGATKTVTQEMLDADVYFYTTSSSTSSQVYTVSNIQIELGTEATEYEPYY